MRVVLLKRKLTSFQIIIIGFSGVIIFGTFLLMYHFPAAADWQRLSLRHCLLLPQQSV